jgi:hypothetical protein
MPNLKEFDDAGLAFIVGARIPDIPCQVKKWRQTHPGEPIPDGQVFVQPTVMGPKADQRHRTIFYQHRTDRATRTLRGIDEQIACSRRFGSNAVGPAAGIRVISSCDPRYPGLPICRVT